MNEANVKRSITKKSCINFSSTLWALSLSAVVISARFRADVMPSWLAETDGKCRKKRIEPWRVKCTFYVSTWHTSFLGLFFIFWKHLLNFIDLSTLKIILDLDFSCGRENCTDVSSENRSRARCRSVVIFFPSSLKFKLFSPFARSYHESFGAQMWTWKHRRISVRVVNLIYDVARGYYKISSVDFNWINTLLLTHLVGDSSRRNFYQSKAAEWNFLRLFLSYFSLSVVVSGLEIEMITERAHYAIAA